MKQLLPYLIITAIFVSSILQAQNKTTTLQFSEKTGTRQVVPIRQFRAYEVKDKHVFKNIPQYPHAILRELPINDGQYMHDKALVNQLTIKDYLAYLASWEIDSASISPQPIEKNTVGIFVALDSIGKKHVIIDANNNRDFSDDKDFVFDTSNYHVDYRGMKLLPAIKILAPYYTGNSIKNRWISLTINPYDHYFNANQYPDDISMKLDLLLERNTYLEATTMIDGKEEKIFAWYNHGVLPGLRDSSIRIRLARDSSTNYTYIPGERITAGNTEFSLSSTNLAPSGDKMAMQLNHFHDNLLGDVAEGDNMPAINTSDIITHQTITTRQLAGKYLLIDFWGSWCAPCISMIPELVKLYPDYKKRGVEFVSIALDKQENITKLKSIITQNEMPWIQLWQDWDTAKNNGSITKAFKVEVFPTYMLISPSGKILSRGIKEEGLQKAIKILNNIQVN